MKLEKTSEKIIIWQHRNKITGEQIAKKIGITRQAWSQKLKDNIFNHRDIIILKSMGFNE